MTLVASGDMYLIGSSGLGATRSIAYEVTGAYTEPAFFSDLLDDACSLPVAFSGNQMSDFYGHTQSERPHAVIVDSTEYIGILSRVTVDWHNDTNGCSDPERVYVRKRFNGGSWENIGNIYDPTTIIVNTETRGSSGSDYVEMELTPITGGFSGSPVLTGNIYYQ
jgi:hypothetical protein